MLPVAEDTIAPSQSCSDTGLPGLQKVLKYVQTKEINFLLHAYHLRFSFLHGHIDLNRNDSNSGNSSKIP